MKAGNNRVDECSVADAAKGDEKGYVTTAKNVTKTWSVQCNNLIAPISGEEDAVLPQNTEVNTFTAHISGNDDFVIKVAGDNQGDGTYPVQVTNQNVPKTLWVRKQFIVAAPVFDDETEPVYDEKNHTSRRTAYFTKRETYLIFGTRLWTSVDYFKDMWATSRDAKIDDLVESTNIPGQIMNNYYAIKNLIVTITPPLDNVTAPAHRQLDERCKLYLINGRTARQGMYSRNVDAMDAFVSADRFEENEFMLLQENRRTPSEQMLKGAVAFTRSNEENAYVLVYRHGDVRALAFFTIRSGDINITNMCCSVGHASKSACECMLREIENIGKAVDVRQINVSADMTFVLRDCTSVSMACERKTGGPFTYSSLGFKWLGQPAFDVERMTVIMTKYAW